MAKLMFPSLYPIPTIIFNRWVITIFQEAYWLGCKYNIKSKVDPPRKRSLKLLFSRAFTGITIESPSLIAYPALEETDDAIRLIHRSATHWTRYGSAYLHPRKVGLSFEKKFRRDLFFFEWTA